MHWDVTKSHQRPGDRVQKANYWYKGERRSDTRSRNESSGKEKVTKYSAILSLSQYSRLSFKSWKCLQELKDTPGFYSFLTLNELEVGYNSITHRLVVLGMMEAIVLTHFQGVTLGKLKAVFFFSMPFPARIFAYWEAFLNLHTTVWVITTCKCGLKDFLKVLSD